MGEPATTAAEIVARLQARGIVGWGAAEVERELVAVMCRAGHSAISDCHAAVATHLERLSEDHAFSEAEPWAALEQAADDIKAGKHRKGE